MFVRTATVGAAALGSGLGLSGCGGGPASERVDTLILGSGFGGSISAYRLAMAGHRTVLLERGRRWTINTPGEDVFSSMRPGEIDMRSTWLAACMRPWSGAWRCLVQGGLWMPSLGSSHCSMPVITAPTVLPYLNHCLKLRLACSSACSQLCSKACG